MENRRVKKLMPKDRDRVAPGTSKDFVRSGDLNFTLINEDLEDLNSAFDYEDSETDDYKENSFEEDYQDYEESGDDELYTDNDEIYDTDESVESEEIADTQSDNDESLYRIENYDSYENAPDNNLLDTNNYDGSNDEHESEF